MRVLLVSRIARHQAGQRGGSSSMGQSGRGSGRPRDEGSRLEEQKTTSIVSAV